MERPRTGPNTPLSAIASSPLRFLAPEDTLSSAVRLMGSNRISSIPVLDHERRPVGILTERLLLKALLSNLVPHTPLAKVMEQPVTVAGTISCQEAFRICLREDIRHLILVDENGQALALVSETDFHRHMHLVPLASQTLVGSIMRRSFCVLGPETPLNTALEQMYERVAGGIVVVQAQRPVGILSGRDLAGLYLSSVKDRQCRLAEVMTRPVRTIPVNTTLAEAATGMLNDRIRQYPVVDQDGLLVGLVASHDLIQALAFALPGPEPAQETDIIHTLLEQAPFPLIITGIDDGFVHFLNSRAERQFELNGREMLGKPIKQFYCDPEDRKKILSILRRDGKVLDFGVHLTNTKGKFFQALLSTNLIKYRNKPAILTALNDITEQQRATNHLQRERAKLEGLLRTIPDPLWVKDPDGRFLLCNPACERYLGAQKTEIVGKTDYDFISKEQADFFRLHDQQAIGAGQPRVNEERLKFANEGLWGLFETIRTPLKDESGTLIGVLGIARDVTERRREQRDLRERAKERQCLYRIFAVTENLNIPFAEQIQQVVELIPSGWQYPEMTGARICYQQAVYATTDFHELPWMLTAEVITGQGEAMQLTIGYREERPQEEEGPFLDEKRELAEAIVHRLAEVANRRSSLDAIKARDQLIACMFSQTTDAITLVDAESQRFLEFNHVAHTSLGYTDQEFSRLSVQDIQAGLSPAQIKNDIERVLQGQALSFETQLRHKDGSLRDTALTLRSLPLRGKQVISGVSHDITEHKARQRELEESQKRLKAITDSALDAILMMDSQGFISYWNPAAERMLGYQADEVLGKDLHLLLAPERYHAAHLRAFDQFLLTGSGRAVGKTIELSALRKDGQEITISLSLSSVKLNDDWHAVGILRDISALKQHQAALEAALTEAKAANQEKTEVLVHLEELVQARTAELDAVNEQLRASEKRYALALEATSDGLWDWNMATDELYCSPAYYRMLGYTPGELAPTGQASAIDRLHPEERERVLTAIKEQLNVKTGDNFELEFRMVAKNGDPVWILSRGKVVERTADGRPARALGIHTDLTARKRIEMELRTASEEQQAIFNAAAMGIFLVKDRMIIRCNRRLEEIFGYGPGELTGKITERWYPSHAEYLQTGKNIVHAVTTQGLFQAEIQLRRKDGSLFWGRTRARALDRSDLSKGVVGMLEDITEERKAAEALRRAKEEAEAANRAKSGFLANMSHEIRTPMNAILGFAHLIKRDSLSPQQTHQLDKLASASRHLLHIINDILDISKIEANKMTLDIDDFEPARVVDQVCGIIADKAAAKNIELRVDLHHIPEVLRGDGPHLGQILLNLMGNAVKFTEKGHIDITACVTEEHPDKVVLRFAVTDTGIGMNENELKRLFKPFEQGDTSTTRRFGGTGLGLAISKKLVELMGGRIGAESREGLGTIFWLEIPFRPSAKAPKHRLHVTALHGQSVLVIDDSAESREILAAMLQEIGMRVQTVATGAAGLELISRADRSGTPFSLVMTDWQLADFDGIALMQQLAGQNLRTKPAVLMITAQEKIPSLEFVQDIGIRKILVKPVTPSQLLDTLMEIMSPPIPVAPVTPSLEQAPEQRRGARILLVEDNFVNQEVAHMLLESMGMEVTVADNGADALARVGQKPFDLVFMDIQMPVMDGLAATKAIRELPGKQSLPILAMTANAFSEDRDRCLRAGMNDHIAKPIELEKLKTLLDKWLPTGNPPHREQFSFPAAAASGESGPGIGNKLRAIEGLDVEAGLRLLRGDEQTYLRLLSQFVQQHGHDDELLNSLIHIRDWTGLREQAHALKGAAATLGVRHIERIAAALEKNALDQPTESGLLQHIGELHPALRHFCRSVGLIPAGPPATAEAGNTPDRQQAREILQRLETFLTVEDSAVNDLFDEHQALLQAAYGPRIPILGHQIASFDYADALNTVRGLLARQ